MPYPHSNSDGKATLGHDEKGMPLPSPPIPDYWHPSSGKTIASFNHVMEEQVKALKESMEKDILAYKKLEKNLFPTPGELGKPEKGGYVTFDIIKPPDPVLIPATEKYTDLWKPLYHGELPKPIPIKTLDMEVYVKGIPLPAKKIGLRIPINTHQDYTESHVRKMLEDSFRKITDHIIEGMKENKK